MGTTPVQVNQSSLEVLSRAVCNGNALALTGQLDRKAYEDVNKVLTAAGGKWDKRAKAHIFDGSAADAIDPILLTGEVRLIKQEFGQFDSPEDVAGRVVALADIDAGMAVLEPSAGIGNIAAAAKRCGAHVTCWEIDEKRAQKLEGIAASLNVGDFLAAPSGRWFDRVVMNPPFARQADIEHVTHALKFLKQGGLLVSVMAAGVRFRQDKKATAFRALVDEAGGYFEDLPDDAFKASGTGVSTVIVVIPATGEA